MEKQGGCGTLFRLVGGAFRGPDPLHEVVPRSGCTAGEEEGEGKDAFFGDFLLDWIGRVDVSLQVKTELKARRTSRRGKRHDNNVSEKTEGYDPRHHARSKIVAENFAEEDSGHVEIVVQSLVHRYSAQLSRGQPCPKIIVVALTYAILTSINRITTSD